MLVEVLASAPVAQTTPVPSDGDGNSDLMKVLLAVLPIAGGFAGYFIKAQLDRRGAGPMAADAAVFKQFGAERMRLLDELGTLLFDLNHWLRIAIPREEGKKRKSLIASSKQNIDKARERSRDATGVVQDEKRQLIEVVRAETDAAKSCVAAYERNEAPDLSRFDEAQTERLRYTKLLERTLRLPASQP